MGALSGHTVVQPLREEKRVWSHLERKRAEGVLRLSLLLVRSRLCVEVLSSHKWSRDLTF
jgi:hypothetical protein